MFLFSIYECKLFKISLGAVGTIDYFDFVLMGGSRFRVPTTENKVLPSNRKPQPKIFKKIFKNMLTTLYVLQRRLFLAFV